MKKQMCEYCGQQNDENIQICKFCAAPVNVKTDSGNNNDYEEMKKMLDMEQQIAALNQKMLIDDMTLKMYTNMRGFQPRMIF